MNTKGIQAFLAIIENGSISKAADILHLSQSSVSHRLINLENELGFKLIERQPGIRGITLTNYGRAFINVAEKSILIEKEIKNIRLLSHKIPLNIGTADSISLYLLPPLYKTLLDEFEYVQPRIITQHTLETYESIKAGDVDIGFVKRDFNMPNIIVNKILDEEMVLVRYGQPSHNIAPINPCELNSCHEIFMDWGYSYQIWHDSLWKEDNHMIRVDAAHLIFDLLNNENQWSIVPKSIFETMKNRGPFYEQPLTNPPPTRSCYLIKHKYVNSNKLHAINFIENYYSKL